MLILCMPQLKESAMVKQYNYNFMIDSSFYPMNLDINSFSESAIMFEMEDLFHW